MKKMLFFWCTVLLFSCKNTNSQIIEDVAVSQFQLLVKNNKGIILDVRTPQEFSSGHIHNATNINFYADDFMDNIIIKYFNPKYIVAGFNHTFGYNRKGDSNFLSDYCQRKEIGLEIVRPLKDSDVIISSTNIRRLIINGFIRRANFELGSIFGFSAKVVHGSGRGKGLEFPTANLVPLEKRQLLPKKGVYFTRCIINGLNHYGMCNFGTRPTFGEDDLVLEVHLLNDYSKDFYNDIVWIEFLERIRSEVKFSSVNELTEQLYKDKNKSLILKDKYELGG